MAEARRWQGPKIEGGVDAIVLGATADALTAAALMARGGLHVVLIDTGPGRPADHREFAPGYFAHDGDPIAASLDQETIEALDLYRHGLSFARRRLETLARFSDGATLILPGDPALYGEAVALMSEDDAENFAGFLDEERKRARAIAGWIAGDEAPAKGAVIDAASVDGALVGRFRDRRLEDYLRAEAALGAASRPSDAFTYLALVRRLAGDAAGLQGALAAIDGGGRGLANALRRAGQAAGVDFRQTDRVRRVIVEWDRVAGVEFDDGGQIRAPIIVTAFPGRDAFLRLIGRERLDIEFARLLDAPPPRLASLRLHLAINGPLADPQVSAALDRRFFLAPEAHELDRAWRLAGEGAAPDIAIAEMLFESALDPALAPEGCHSASLLLHPVANRALDDEDWRGALETAARAIIERLIPGTSGAVKAVHLSDAVPAAPPTIAAIDRRRRITDASGLDGYFFCGPEALIGGGVSLTAGRRAGERAVAYFKQGGASR